MLDTPIEQQGIFAAQSYVNAADKATRINALDTSIGYTLRAIAITERLRGQTHPDLVDPLSLLGEAYLRTTRYADAGAVLTRAVAIADSAPKVPVMARVLALRSLGGFYAQTGRSDLGARLFERAVAVGEADPTTSRMMAGVYRDLASLHVQSRRFAQARAMLAKAAANAERATGKSSSAYGGVLLDIAEMEVDASDLNAAERAAVEARAALAVGLEAANARNGHPIAVQARIAFRRGNTVEAARLYDDALRLMKKPPQSRRAHDQGERSRGLVQSRAEKFEWMGARSRSRQRHDRSLGSRSHDRRDQRPAHGRPASILRRTYRRSLVKG